MADDDNIIRLSQAQGRQPPWWDELMMDGKHPLGNLANVLTALRGDPATQNCFAFDEMLRAPTWKRERPVTDADAIEVQEWLQRVGLRSVGKETVFSAVPCRARTKLSPGQRIPGRIVVGRCRAP